MTIGFVFWLLLLLALIFNVFWMWPTEPGRKAFGALGIPLFWVILFLLLGLGVFGCPIETPPSRPMVQQHQ